MKKIIVVALLLLGLVFTMPVEADELSDLQDDYDDLWDLYNQTVILYHETWDDYNLSKINATGIALNLTTMTNLYNDLNISYYALNSTYDDLYANYTDIVNQLDNMTLNFTALKNVNIILQDKVADYDSLVDANELLENENNESVDKNNNLTFLNTDLQAQLDNTWRFSLEWLSIGMIISAMIILVGYIRFGEWIHSTLYKHKFGVKLGEKTKNPISEAQMKTFDYKEPKKFVKPATKKRPEISKESDVGNEWGKK